MKSSTSLSSNLENVSTSALKRDGTGKHHQLEEEMKKKRNHIFHFNKDK